MCFTSLTLCKLTSSPSTVPSSGPPITLGWDVQDTLESDIDTYEACRNGDDAQDSLRRSKNELLIPQDYREELLLETGYSHDEIKVAIKKVEKDKSRRSKSIRQHMFEMNVRSRLVSARETVRSGLRRVMPSPSLGRRRRTHMK